MEISEMKERISGLTCSAKIRDIEIKDIIVEKRFRKDYGNLDELVANIMKLGLLQPIGINSKNRLLYGGRRLEAYRRLNMTRILARIVDVDSIMEVEEAENNVRKDFTRSERIAIAHAIRKEFKEKGGQTGAQLGLLNKGTKLRDVVAAKAGFANHTEMERTQKVLENGTENLIKAMDAGEISVSKGAQLSLLPKEQQDKALEIAKQPRPKRSRRIIMNTIILGGLSINAAIEPALEIDLEFAMTTLKKEIELELSKL